MYKSIFYFIFFSQKNSKVFFFTIIAGLISLYYLTLGVNVVQVDSDLIFEGLWFPTKNNGLEGFLNHIGLHSMFLLFFVIGIFSSNINSFYTSNFVSQYLIKFPERVKLILILLFANTIIALIIYIVYISIMIFFHLIENQINLFNLYYITWGILLYFYYAISLIFCVNIYSLNNSYGTLNSIILLVIAPIFTTLVGSMGVEGRVFNLILNYREILFPYIPEFYINILKNAFGLEPLHSHFHLFIYSLVLNFLSFTKVKSKVF